jgi:hypothetical protein
VVDDEGEDFLEKITVSRSRKSNDLAPHKSLLSPVSAISAQNYTHANAEHVDGVWGNLGRPAKQPFLIQFTCLTRYVFQCSKNKKK